MRIGVIGAGSWGTALSALLAEDSGNQVTLWAYEKDVAQGVLTAHENSLYLKGIALPPSLGASSNLEEVLSGKEVLLNAVPSHLTRSVWEKGRPHVRHGMILVNASKGFEFDSRKRLSQVLRETLLQLVPGAFVTLSGPSFAREVALHQPTTVVIAGGDLKTAEKIQRLFRRDWFLTYLNDDMIGVEVGGAVKNVIAIAAGVCEGMGLGYNTRAALITRGLYEMAKLGKALGANPITFAGLSGIGDLVLTCTGDLSRNRSVGLRLGRGERLQKITAEMKMVAEGIKSAKVVYDLSREHGLGNPVCSEIYRILYEGKSPSQALKDLLTLELKEEMGGLFR